MLADPGQIHELVDGAQQVACRHMTLQRKLVEQRRLVRPPIAHHHRISPR